ncbi:MAG TPA: peptidoglycan-binding protein, partial [Planctomycetota bacterium]|nr:peptidoglycan-binding protein [Planctomycetota bacterium]
ARTPQEAQKLIKELLATLRAAGFPVSATGSTENQLGSALKLFQESRGLPPNGRLDEKTRDALVDAGHLAPPAKSEAADAGVGQKRDAPQVDLRPRADAKLGVGELSMRAPTGSEARPDGAKSSQGVELSQLSERSARDKPPEVDLKSFLSSLRAAGFQGQGKGAEQLKDSLKRLQKAEGLPQSGQLDARTAAALVRRGIVDERVMPMTLANAQNASDAQLARSDTKRENEARVDTKDARQEPSTRGARETAETDASKGRGDVEGRDAATGAKGGEGDARDAASTSRSNSAHEAEGQEGTGDVNDPWREGVEGNAPAGDDDVDDPRRGRANIDDDALEQDESGHWEVEALSVQIEAGLAAIARDDDGSGAATYAWDFTLYRPGVYGAKQPAEKLFHLVVTKASAFDALWEQAREALNDKLALLEPEAKRITIDDVTRTLRVARMKTREVPG